MYSKIIVLGVVVSILFTEFIGLSPAGIIVPSYITLCLRTPQRVVYTLLVALLMIILSFSIDLLIGGIMTEITMPSLIGILVPGIMASEFERQGVIRSLFSLGIVVGIISMIMLICGIPVLTI